MTADKKGKCPLLKLGKTERWRQDFAQGYLTEETRQLAQGIVIDDLDELLKYPLHIRYFEADYKEALDKSPRVISMSAFCKGVAVAKWSAWIHRETEQ